MDSPLSIVMLGTGDFALPSFVGLADAGFRMLTLVTQPDRPQGRKQELIPSLVKQVAVRRGVPVFQPERVNDAEAVEHVRSLAPDFLITAAYGQILSAELLAIPYAAQLPVRALRIFTTYGAVRDGRLVADLIHRVESGHPVTVQGDRGLMTSPIHASDVARAVIAAVAQPPDAGELDLVNVGGAPLGIRDMATAIGRVLGREPVFEARPGQPPCFVADRSKCERVLGVPDPVEFEAGIAMDLEAV